MRRMRKVGHPTESSRWGAGGVTQLGHVNEGLGRASAFPNLSSSDPLVIFTKRISNGIVADSMIPKACSPNFLKSFVFWEEYRPKVNLCFELTYSTFSTLI